MLSVIEILPLQLHICIGRKLGIALGFLKAAFVKYGDQIFEKQGIDTFILIFRLDGPPAADPPHHCCSS